MSQLVSFMEVLWRGALTNSRSRKSISTCAGWQHRLALGKLCGSPITES
jgi:hypothetical protein